MTSQTPIIPKRLHVRDHETSMKYTGGSTHSSISKGDNMRGLNATLGMVIHGAADGIALGASSLSGSGSLGLIIFLAVLVHKGESELIFAFGEHI
jgi:zinc transporter 9